MDSEVDDMKQSDPVASPSDDAGSIEAADPKEMMTLPPKKKSKKKPLFVIAVLIALLLTGFFFKSKIKSLLNGEVIKSNQPAASQIPKPSPTPNPLVRSDWSFEVLNGSGATGFAKNIAGKLQALGYQVVKIGNADRNDYQKTEVLIKKNLLDKIDFVIADLKDTIKIASIAGELKEGTASARIIIGKDAI